MKLIIDKADNGYLLTINRLDQPPEFQVFENSTETAGGEQESMTNLLYQIADELGYSYDKYGKNNLEISFTKIGHKIEE